MKLLLGLGFLFLLGGAALYSALASLKSGQIRFSPTGYIATKRFLGKKDAPRLFWFTVSVQLMMAIGCGTLIGYTLIRSW